jgi:dihydroxyacid dehydratase/phosphogluconate dehydratase
MLKAIGFTGEELAKPIIGVANTWIETMPCNYNLRELAVKVMAFAPRAALPWSSTPSPTLSS